MTTLRWPLAARLALAFHALGCEIRAWCPTSHPLAKSGVVERRYRARVFGRLRSLRAAIESAAPDLIVACDDAATVALHRLHRSLRDDVSAAAIRQVIERSLGTPSASALATDRGALMRMAAAEGVRVPEGDTLSTGAELESWCLRHGYPAVLKVDGSWGGLGVAVVHDLEQARARFREFMSPRLLPALSQWILRRDGSHLRARFARARPNVTVQRFIAGTPANRAVACWQGDVLAGISVVAVATQAATGPATVVRVVENDGMSDATARLIRALGLSGLCGLDFVIERATGLAYLIEVNPRATPICHLPLGTGRDLPAALCASMTGNVLPLQASSIAQETIALFPGECQRDSRSDYLRSAFHDVPWSAPALVRDGLARPWEQRGLAARLRALFKSAPREDAALVNACAAPSQPE